MAELVSLLITYLPITILIFMLKTKIKLTIFQTYFKHQNIFTLWYCEFVQIIELLPRLRCWENNGGPSH